MKIIFKFATRERPAFFKRAIENIISLSESNNYLILVSLDGQDESMGGPTGYEEHPNVMITRWSGRVTKIQNINRGIDLIKDWDILVGMSDDMVFLNHGFDNVIRANFDGNLDQCLHFPDGNRRDLLTMPVMGRPYYDRFGYIYHPDYISLWCDNEQMQVAMKLNKYKFVDLEVFHHLHYEWGKAPNDESYILGRSFYYVDQETFNRRQAINFDLKQGVEGWYV